MTARLLRAGIALLTLLMEIRYTISRLTAAQVLSASVAKFQALRDGWTVVQSKEIALHEQLSDALSQVDVADDKLDNFAARFQQALLIVTNQKRDVEQYTHFFKKTLNELTRPTLSGQLTTMAAWIKSLEQPTTHPNLAAMLPELITLVGAGKAAEDLRDETRLKIKQFREVGERRQFIDQVNAERKELHGALSKLALATPGLPTDFANHFFKPGETPEEAPEETIESLGGEIKQLDAALKLKQTRLDEMIKEAATAAEKAEKKASKKAKLDLLNQEIEAKAKQAKELEEEIDGE